MKTKIILFIAPLIFALSACSDSKVSPSDVSTTLKNGTWKVSFYWDTDHETTGDFNGYNFIFAANNVITAKNGNTQLSGTWYTTDSGDNSGNETELAINFGAAVFPVNELNETWFIIEKSATMVRMRHEGGGGATTLLTFQKL